MWASQQGRDRLEKDLVRTAEDGTLQQTILLAACKGRDRNYLHVRESWEVGLQSRYRYVYHVLKPILPTTATSSTRHGSCRHARASTTLRPHLVQGCQYDLADCFEHVQNNRRGLPFWQDLPDPSSSITFPTRPLHDVHVHSRLRQDLVPFD